MFGFVCTVTTIVGILSLWGIFIWNINKQNKESPNIDVRQYLHLEKEEIIALHKMLDPKDDQEFAVKLKIEYWFYFKYRYSIQSEIIGRLH
jgi:hypothetical protein